MGDSTAGCSLPSQYMRMTMSLRLSSGGGGAIVIQMWLIIPAPSTSKIVRVSPLPMFSRRSLFPPERS